MPISFFIIALYNKSIVQAHAFVSFIFEHG